MANYQNHVFKIKVICAISGDSIENFACNIRNDGWLRQTMLEKMAMKFPTYKIKRCWYYRKFKKQIGESIFKWKVISTLTFLDDGDKMTVNDEDDMEIILDLITENVKCIHVEVEKRV